MIEESMQQFMVENSYLYASMNQECLAKTINDCVKSKQYLYEPNKYVWLYWLIHEKDIDSVCSKKIPDDIDITGGNILYITECCCKDDEGMKKAIKILRKLPFKGLFWHRNNKPMIFPRQKGVMI